MTLMEERGNGRGKLNGEEGGLNTLSSNLPVGHSSRTAGTTAGVSGSTAEVLTILHGAVADHFEMGR